MFLFLIGGVVGFFAGFVFFVGLLIIDSEVNIAIATNLVIAFATVIATVIHFSSIKQQRKDRLWDINKPILLDLSHSLSSVIKASEFYLQEEYARAHIDDQPKEIERPRPNVFKEFHEKREYALNVYKSLMSQELIDALAEAKRLNDNIDHGVNEHGVDHITAYEQSIDTNKALQEKLDFFIAKLSGVSEL